MGLMKPPGVCPSVASGQINWLVMYLQIQEMHCRARSCPLPLFINCQILRRFIERAKQTTHQTSYVWPSCFSSVAYKCKSGRVIRSAQARSLWRAPAARWYASQPPRDDSDGLLLLLILSLSLLLPMLLFRQAVTMEATPERRGFESSCCCLFSIASPLPLPPAVVTMGTLLDDGWVASSIKRRP